MLGTVKFFLATQSYGFIAIEGGLDFFFHGAQVVGEVPKAGDQVSFWLSDDSRGRLEAVEVQVRTRF